MKTQKKVERERKDIEAKVKSVDVRDIQATFPDRDKTTWSDLADILTGAAVGRNICHTWYDADAKEKTTYSSRIEKLKERKCDSICYWDSGETYDDAVDYTISISNGKGQRQAHHTTQQQCPAGLRIRLTKDATKLVVASVNEEHNHQMNEALFKYLPRQRRLDSSMEAETGRLLALHANKKLVQQHIREQGKEVTLKDLHNIKARTRPTHGSNLQSLLTEMQKDTGAVTELVVGSSNELVAISYQTTAMKNSQIRFPELLLLDATYKLNDLRMPLYVLMVVDGNGESVVIGLWIVANEERATISGLMDIFAKHNDTASIKCVMANKDMVERDVIREKLPVQPYRSACSTHCVRSVERLLQRSLASDLMSGWSASS
ncbi:hypothetical protein LSAT2_015340 [Lamellibrachia satsuma]|nr:hypothetical protein LSAT2_015340 [Lamellibrachia satsuma]